MGDILFALLGIRPYEVPLTPNSEIRYGRRYEEKRVFHAIPEGVGEVVLQNPDARYYDRDSGNRIAVRRMYVLGAERDIAAAYEISDNIPLLITVFPLKERQQQNRRRNGRWVPYELDS